MLEYTHSHGQVYRFNDLNPSIIGHKIRWVKDNPNNDPRGEQGRSLTVLCYSEQSDELYDYEDETIHLDRKVFQLRTFEGEKLLLKKDDKFTINSPKNFTKSEKFRPDMDLVQYTYHEVGGDIVGNCVMVETGTDTNHPWGDFITGRVSSYKPSGAIVYGRIHPLSAMYEVKLEGVERPVVVDTYSRFWA